MPPEARTVRELASQCLSTGSSEATLETTGAALKLVRTLESAVALRKTVSSLARDQFRRRGLTSVVSRPVCDSKEIRNGW